MTRVHAPSEFLADRLADSADEASNKKLVRLAAYRRPQQSKPRRQTDRRDRNIAPCKIIDFVGGGRGG